MRRWFSAHVGLVPPYRFERTLIALPALALGILAGAAAAYFLATGGMTADSARSLYLLYLGGLAALAFGLVRWPYLAGAVLVVAVLEAGLGLGSLLLYKLHVIPFEVTAPPGKPVFRSQWHPLLQAVPVPSAAVGVRGGIYINRDGQRGRERTAEMLRGKIIVALFGGSSTLDPLPDGFSWPERLQQLLGDRYEVVNHGVGGFTTAEHLIQTAFYEQTKGQSPRCAVYYVGWNELRNAHVRDLDPGYADLHLRSQDDLMEARRTSLPESVSPLLRLVAIPLGWMFDTVPPQPTPRGEAGSEPDPILEAIFARNVGAISAINRQRGIVTIWVGQLMNRAALTSDGFYGWLPFVRDRDVFPMVVHLNGVLAREAAALGDIYVDLPIARFENGGMRDQGHFTPAGSLEFATLLAPTIAQNCR